MTPEDLKMYSEHYGNICIIIGITSGISPSTIQNNARRLNRVLNLGILK